MSILERDQQYVWHPYTQMKTAPLPIPIVRGEGAWLYDENGRAYLDAVSSWWVNIHGHAHPFLAERVNAQFHTLEHIIFAGFTHPPAVELAEQLVQVLPDNQARIFYSDNGSTAVEIGIKMAVQYFYNQGQARPKIIAFENGFHGETFGAMAASSPFAFNRAWQDMLFQVERIPVPLAGQEAESLAALDKILATEEVAAFLFEPLIQGAGGMVMYSPEALDALIEKCREAGVLCIADEVMTGFGRTGRLFASDYLKNPPDIMCMSKGLTGGSLPLAVTSCTQAIYDEFWSDDKMKAFYHGHSYTANPLGCAAALASLELMLGKERQQDIPRIQARHETFMQKIAGHPALSDIRCRGTIIAFEFISPAATGYFNQLRDQLYNFFLDRGLLLRPLGNVIYIMPPYCITDEELQLLYDAIEAAMAWHHNQLQSLIAKSEADS